MAAFDFHSGQVSAATFNIDYLRGLDEILEHGKMLETRACELKCISMPAFQAGTPRIRGWLMVERGEAVLKIKLRTFLQS